MRAGTAACHVVRFSRQTHQHLLRLADAADERTPDEAPLENQRPGRQLERLRRDADDGQPPVKLQQVEVVRQRMLRRNGIDDAVQGRRVLLRPACQDPSSQCSAMQQTKRRATNLDTFYAQRGCRLDRTSSFPEHCQHTAPSMRKGSTTEFRRRC